MDDLMFPWEAECVANHVIVATLTSGVECVLFLLTQFHNVFSTELAILR
jgi:hypothetical protein